MLGIGQSLSKEIVERSLFVFKEQEIHMGAAGTTKRIIRKRSEKRKPPTRKRVKKRAFRRMDSRDKASILNRRR